MYKFKHFKLGLLLSIVLTISLCFYTEPDIHLWLPSIPVLYVLLHIFLYFYLKKRLLRLSIEKIDQLDGQDFEYYLYYLFKKKHIRAHITSYSHDFGADLIVKYHGRKIVIQAKRYTQNVGIKAVQETIGATAYYKAKYGAVITNSFYTKSAKELAEASDIVLLNRYDLIKLRKMRSNEIMPLLLGKV